MLNYAYIESDGGGIYREHGPLRALAHRMSRGGWELPPRVRGGWAEERRHPVKKGLIGVKSAGSCFDSG